MKASEKDKWLDRVISRLAPGDKPVPDFEKWQRDHPEAVQILKSSAGRHCGPSAGRAWIWRTIMKHRTAAAAVLLVIAGYALGRLAAPQPPDIDALENSLRSSLEPAIRRNLLGEMNRRWQLGLASAYAQLKDELGQQFRQDMNEFALQILAASGTATNQRLAELIEAIGAARTQERRWIAEAFEQMELNRLQDKAQLRKDLATFAVQTQEELRQAEQNMVQLLAYPPSGNLVPDVSENQAP